MRTLTFAAFVVAAASIIPSVAVASVSPTLQVAATGNGDAVQVTVTGDPNSSVLLSYTATGSGPQIASLGSTDSNGNFSTTVSSVTYSLTSGTLVTVRIGGTNGAVSPTVAWPSVSSASSLVLSQNALVIVAGSSVSLSATNPGNGIYLSGNSNPSIVNVSISGTTITFSGNTQGSSTVTLCQVGTTSNCPIVYVTVKQAGSSMLGVSQSTASVVAGQSLPITLSGGTGSYLIATNSNPPVIQASISGSVLTLSTGATSGSSSLTVCSSDNALCAVVVATVGSASSAATTLSSSAPTVGTNQSVTVNIYGPTGVQFYVSSNSNPAVVQANLTGTTLTLAGIAAGSSVVTVCSSSASCASLTATVTSAVSAATIALSQTSVTLAGGQNATIIVSGGQPPYAVSGGASSISQETISGSSLTVYGIGPGTSSLSVCSSAGGCVPLSVTVTGASAVSVVSPTPAPVTTSSGLSLTQRQAILSLLQSFGADSTTVAGVEVALGGGQTPVTAAPSADTKHVFTQFLHLTSSGAEVTALQQRLAALGYFSGSVTGYYGPATKAAVEKFQHTHGLTQAGYVGPGTRAALND